MNKWDWMMDYCKKKGQNPADSFFWDQAEKAYSSQMEAATKLKLFRKEWVGRKFKCKKTGEELTIPENVRECEFFSFGECFIDVGRYGFYSRAGGEFEEVKEIVEKDS